jgi:hypothetical protein
MAIAFTELFLISIPDHLKEMMIVLASITRPFEAEL